MIFGCAGPVHNLHACSLRPLSVCACVCVCKLYVRIVRDDALFYYSLMLHRFDNISHTGGKVVNAKGMFC